MGLILSLIGTGSCHPAGRRFGAVHAPSSCSCWRSLGGSGCKPPARRSRPPWLWGSPSPRRAARRGRTRGSRPASCARCLLTGSSLQDRGCSPRPSDDWRGAAPFLSSLEPPGCRRSQFALVERRPTKRKTLMRGKASRRIKKKYEDRLGGSCYRG